MSNDSGMSGKSQDAFDSAVGTVITAAQLSLTGSRTLKFEGADYGSEISFFFVRSNPGQGPELHRHPYTETWIVLHGEATITMGDNKVVATEGTTAVVQPEVWHRFVNSGQETLQMMCIHAAPRMITEFLAS